MHEELRREAKDAAVNGLGDDYVIAGSQETKDRVDAGHARRKDVCGLAAFKLGYSAFERFAVGMIGARVVVTFVFAELGLHVCGSLVDRSDNGAGGGIRLLADVNSIRSKTHEDSCVLDTAYAQLLPGLTVCRDAVSEPLRSKVPSGAPFSKMDGISGPFPLGTAG